MDPSNKNDPQPRKIRWMLLLRWIMLFFVTGILLGNIGNELILGHLLTGLLQMLALFLIVVGNLIIIRNRTLKDNASHPQEDNDDHFACGLKLRAKEDGGGSQRNIANATHTQLVLER